MPKHDDSHKRKTIDRVADRLVEHHERNKMPITREAAKARAVEMAKRYDRRNNE